MLIGLNVFSDGNQEMVLNVSEGCFQEGVACVFDSVCNPRLEMQKFSFSCQNRQGNCKLVVIPVGQRDQAFLYHLGYVQNP